MRSRGQTHCMLPTAASPHDGWHAEIQYLHKHNADKSVCGCRTRFWNFFFFFFEQLWSIHLHLHFLPRAILFQLKPIEPNLIQKQFTMAHSGTSHCITHPEPHRFLLSGSFPYHSNATQTLPIDAA